MAKFSDWVGKLFKTTDAEPIITIFGSHNHSGKSVTQDNALTLSTHWACVRLLSETLAQLPTYLVKKETRAGKRVRIIDDDHPLNLVLKKPNRLMTPAEFTEAMQVNLSSWGNAYADIEKSSSGQVISMTPLLAANMDVIQDPSTGDVNYHYRTREGILVYPAENILHLKLFGWGGLVGLSPVAYAAQSMGLSLAGEEYGARYFGNGARPSGFLMYPGTLKPDQRKRLRENFEDLHEGLDKAHKLAILEADMKYQATSLPPNDSQFLETRNFQVPEVCRWHLVQPHKIGWLDRATYSNIEHQDLEFVKYTVMPYVVRYQQAMGRKLLASGDFMEYQVKFNLGALLTADHTARSQFYSSMVQNGIYTRNEVRELEDRNPSDQPGADDLTVQSNMIDLEQLQKLGQVKGTQQ